MKLLGFNVPKFTYSGYVRHLRKQDIRVQQLHALVFSSILTGLVVFLILYYDYGFFHDVYVREDNTQITENIDAPSPVQTLSSFFGEAKVRFGNLGKSGFNMLNGKDVYINNN